MAIVYSKDKIEFDLEVKDANHSFSPDITYANGVRLNQITIWVKVDGEWKKSKFRSLTVTKLAIENNTKETILREILEV